jgi:hypothetical protein
MIPRRAAYSEHEVDGGLVGRNGSSLGLFTVSEIPGHFQIAASCSDLINIATIIGNNLAPAPLPPLVKL